MTSFWSKILRATSPITGRRITETGEIWNLADIGALKQKYSLLDRTVGNGASEFSARFTVPGGGTYNLGFQPAVGRKIVLWSRELVLAEGAYILKTLNAEWDTESGAALTVGTLDDRCECPVTSDVRHGVTITGSIEQTRRDVSYDAGSQPGQARPATPVNADAAFRVITRPTVLQIEKTDSGSAACSVLYIIWEGDDDGD